ncbi:fibroblast growth factor 8b [Caerostris extrusa]|uniref:Fibroblast growth factor 8b n=1 Tax=Caerostris extrusa TaxID=172846 RepID=A0AAV4QIX3_CAEEX|nr:fibroblast growth factor 8b [Caerostris extrusa]
MASCKSFSVDLEKGAPSIRENPTRSWKSHDIRRSYKLYNQCSGNHVQVVGKLVNAKGSADNPFVNMSFISARSRHHQNAINIVGQKTKNYVLQQKGQTYSQEKWQEEIVSVPRRSQQRPLHSATVVVRSYMVRWFQQESMDEYIPPVKIKPWRLKELLTEGHGHHRSRQQRKVPKTPTR